MVAAVLAVLDRARTGARFFDAVFLRLVDFLVVEVVFFFDTAFLVATFLVDADPFAPAFLPAFLLTRFLVAAFFVPVLVALDFLLFPLAATFLLVDFFLLTFFFLAAFFRLVPDGLRADFFVDLPAADFFEVDFFDVDLLRDVAAVFERRLDRELVAPRLDFVVVFFLAAAFFFGIAPASRGF